MQTEIVDRGAHELRHDRWKRLQTSIMKIPILTVLVFPGFEWGTKLFRRSDEYVNETLVYLFKWIMFNIAFTWCRVLFSILTKSTFWTKISKLNSNLSLQRKGQEQNVFLF